MTAKRIQQITECLEKTFTPLFLEVKDDSEKHKGHAGSQSGAGHFTVTISSEKLKNLSRIEAHRAIYKALEDMIPNDIHALKIIINSKDF